MNNIFEKKFTISWLKLSRKRKIDIKREQYNFKNLNKKAEEKPAERKGEKSGIHLKVYNWVTNQQWKGGAKMVQRET